MVSSQYPGAVPIQYPLQTPCANILPGPVNAVTFSSSGGTYVLTGSTDRAIHLSRAIPSSNSTTAVETTTPIQKYEAHGYSVLDIAVAADNARFASVGGDRQVFLWDVEQGITTKRWSGHNNRVEAVQFAGDGDSVVVTGTIPDSLQQSKTNIVQEARIQQSTFGTPDPQATNPSKPSPMQPTPSLRYTCIWGATR
jgi:mitogen-activated protein kinase organizer 1